MRQEAARLDDSKSSVVAVAFGITAACHVELDRNIDLATNGVQLRNYQRMKDQITEQHLKIATQIVFEHRSSGGAR